MKYGPGMTLEDMRGILERMEDKIITSLYDRAGYAQNACVYEPGKIPIDGSGDSYFCFMFRERQECDALAGRFCISGEVPFFSGLPEPRARRKDPGYPLGHSAINMNGILLQVYMSHLGRISSPGDDGEYGSTAAADIHALDHISTRIHKGGIGVADLKFIGDKQAYRSAAIHGRTQMRPAMMEMLTNKAQEEKVLNRVHEKGKRYGMDPAFVHGMFESGIIPLTKEVEIDRIIELVEKSL